tara:strand:+ start:196 stop:756 length:561 start_codon:yes stop_codon:yes gene_type:complete
MKTIVLGAAAALSLTTAAALADANAANPMVGGAEMFAQKNIIENAVNSPIHTTLVAAVTAADLVDTLQGPGPFTVFAPTDKAFGMISEESLNALLLPENKAQLQQVLTCHVVAGDVMSDALKGMIDADGGSYPIMTVGGCVLQGTYSGDTFTLTDENGRDATVTTADVKQSNGVIHVIDRVLLPKQ